MMSSFIRFSESFYSAHPFLAGIATGIALCLLLYLILLLVRLIRRAGSISDFTYDAPSGRVMIRTAAISDLIFSVGKKFHEIDLLQVVFFRRHGEFYARVNVDYRTGSRLFPEVTSVFQQTVLDTLKSSFGIETVKYVEVCMRNLISTGSQDE